MQNGVGGIPPAKGLAKKGDHDKWIFLFATEGSILYIPT